MGELLPQWVVIENVPGLLKYRARLARDFAELGYGLRWQPIAAQDVGAPHRRRRVFVVACRDWRGSVVLDAPQAGDQAVMWPTPLADGDRAAMFKQGGEPLGHAARAAIWPTPTTQDGSNNGAPSQHERNALLLNAVAGGALNPAWVELLMGLPSGWSTAKGAPMAWPGAHAWPVGRGAAQPESEPPRLVEPGSVPNRNLRLRSLGNGVVPQQAIEAIGRCVRGPRQLGLFT